MNDDEIKGLHDRLRNIGKKISDDAKDEYYESQAARINTVVGGDTGHFLRLQRVRNEWQELADAVPVGQGFLTLYDYVKEYYGVKLEFDGDNIKLEYSVVDEKKYTVFLLKFNR